jgi:hypothetical protein
MEFKALWHSYMFILGGLGSLATLLSKVLSAEREAQRWAGKSHYRGTLKHG